MTEAAAIAKAAFRVGLTDDNPADVDLLGFDAIVTAISQALRQANLDPITIGIHAPWGGGKSTILGLLERELKSPTIVVRTNPWEYDDQFDVKGTLIAEVLGRLSQELGTNQVLKDKVTALFKRISWSRVGMAVAKGILTTQWDPAALVDAFNPQAAEGPRSLAEFRSEFADLLDKIPDVERVVVLVDDLDRCLPPAVLATLEAIKLFLSVKGMAFVIAADQDMIRDAIAANLAATNRSEVFADRYLEKIVQLPVALPRLSQPETEAYIALLLAAQTTAYTDLLHQLHERRRAHQVPLVTPEGHGDPLVGEILTLAAQIAEGLSPSRRGNPREVKRFLNAFGVRSLIAEGRGVSLAPAVMIKLLFLEEQHDAEFKTLVGYSASERKAFLRDWEAWARDGKPVPEADGKALVRNETKAWAATDPQLAGEELDAYITLAASLAAASVRGGMSDEVRGVVRELLEQGETNRSVAIDRAAKLPIEDQQSIVTAILAESRRSDNVVPSVEALVGLGKATPALVGDIVTGIRSHLWSKLEEDSAVTLATSGVAEFVELTNRMAEDTSLQEGVRIAARDALGTPEGKA
jgi:KAP family P-loop domain